MDKKKEQQTIDEKHSDLMQMYHLLENETIPKMKQEITDLIQEAKNTRNKKSESFFDLVDNIKNKKKELKNLEKSKNDYLLNNSKYIFQYYEEKQKISWGDNTKDTTSISRFFKIKANNEESANINSDKYKQSKKLFQQYWKNIGEGDVALQEYMMDADHCSFCNQGELVPLEEEGVLICNNIKCGKFLVNIVDNQKPLNKEIPNEVSYTAYIRLNHFKEILSQFQAKETTKIPDEVLDAVKKRIKKERKNIADLNYTEMRHILSVLGYNKYF